jgi:hypothetical protein
MRAIGPALSLLLVAWAWTPAPVAAAELLSTTIEQITFGPNHHFFGYFGHAGTIPWNASGRYIVALRTPFQGRMPMPGEAAEIVLLDASDGYAARVVDRTRAWNFQQGTMLYWNPQAAETEFFFNDRDPETNEVFCVRFDIAKGASGERVAEYRFRDQPIGNGGVAQRGGRFLGINYGRLDRLRPVTGYPGAGGKNYYTILRRGDGAWTRTARSDQGGYTSGELRIDPSPCWNRDGTKVLVIAVDARRTRQIHLTTVNAARRP